MKTLLAAAAVAALAAGAAAAQPRYQPPYPPQGAPPPPARGPSITFYEFPNFQGAARTFTGTVENLADLGFNDRAQSARVQGRWRVCENADFRGRCADVVGDVANLADLRLTAAISSFELVDQAPYGGYDRGPYPGGGGYDRGPYPGGARGYQGGAPPYGPGDAGGERLDGRSVSFFPRPGPGPYRNAEEFCRRLGFSGVIYADDRGQQLRDVVCRR